MAEMQAAEALELAALLDLYSSTPTSGVAVERFGDARLLLFPEGPAIMSNRLLFDGTNFAISDAELDRLEHFTASRRIAWVVALPPSAPASVETRLRARGFTSGYAWMKFVRDSAGTVAEDTKLRIARVGSCDTQAFSAIIVDTFAFGSLLASHLDRLPGRPGWHCFLACAGDTPIGAAALFVQGKNAWLSFAATRTSYRRCGAQSALLAARIREAANLRATQIYVETGKRVIGKPDQSYRNLLRAGFRELYVRQNLLCPNFERLVAENRVRATIEKPSAIV